MPYLMIKVFKDSNNVTIDNVNFEQLGPGILAIRHPFVLGPVLVIFINDIEPAMDVLVKKGADFANKYRTTSSK